MDLVSVRKNLRRDWESSGMRRYVGALKSGDVSPHPSSGKRPHRPLDRPGRLREWPRRPRDGPGSSGNGQMLVFEGFSKIFQKNSQRADIRIFPSSMFLLENGASQQARRFKVISDSRQHRQHHWLNR